MSTFGSGLDKNETVKSSGKGQCFAIRGTSREKLIIFPMFPFKGSVHFTKDSVDAIYCFLEILQNSELYYLLGMTKKYIY